MIKPVFEAISTQENQSFHFRSFEEPAFSAPYHFHPEYELTLILKGEGYRYIGNHMDSYTAGDLLLLGSDLPHCWKSAPVPGHTAAAAVVVQFKEDFLGKDFLDRPEMKAIRQVLQKSARGIQLLGSTAGAVRDKMIAMTAEEDVFKKLLGLLDCLHTTALSNDCLLLNRQPPAAGRPHTHAERINAVTAYIVDHFRGDIFLEKAASIASLSPNAFCKYYKRTTRKTFMETVIDYRINYAIQQLLHTEQSVSDICFDSGFGDLSNFNKLFKRKMKLSPLQYRKKFKTGI